MKPVCTERIIETLQHLGAEFQKRMAKKGYPPKLLEKLNDRYIRVITARLEKAIREKNTAWLTLLDGEWEALMAVAKKRNVGALAKKLAGFEKELTGGDRQLTQYLETTLSCFREMLEAPGEWGKETVKEYFFHWFDLHTREIAGCIGGQMIGITAGLLKEKRRAAKGAG